MQKQVAFLHTSPLHTDTFERLMAEVDPGVKIAHVVREDLLVDAQRVGAEDPALTARVHGAMVDAAASTGATLVVCTCSTVGGAAERTPTQGRFAALRIDRAMADRAVLLGPRILVVAALASTVAPTLRLVEESAVSQGVDVDVECLVADGAWAHFVRGDREAYVAAVAAAIRNAAPHAASVIVLAQASMAPVAEGLTDLGVPILSSPRLGVEAVIERLRGPVR